jgi:hypothetical protein
MLPSGSVKTLTRSARTEDIGRTYRRHRTAK